MYYALLLQIIECRKLRAFCLKNCGYVFFLKKISSLYVLSLAVQGVPAVFACIPSPCYQNLVDM